MARTRSANRKSKDSTATIGFEATAMRDSAASTGEAFLRSLSAAKDNRWLTADSRGEAETAAGNRSNNMDAAEPSEARQTAKSSPQGERGCVHQFYTPSCVVRCLVEMLAPYTALRGSAFLQSEASPQVVSAAKDKGRIYDPACGSGGNLPASRLCGVRFAEKDRAIAQGVVQSEKFFESHGRTCNGMQLALAA